MAILKITADTNAGQSHRLSHCYYLKSLIFKHSLLFIHTFKNTTQLSWIPFFCASQSLTNAISLPLVYSISSKHVFIAVSNFSDRTKKKKHWNLTLPVQFSSPHPGKSQKSPSPGRPYKSNSPLPGHRTVVKCPGFARGDVGGSIWLAHKWLFVFAGKKKVFLPLISQ